MAMVFMGGGLAVITRRNQILRRSTFVQLEGYSTRLIVVEVPIGPWYFFVMLSIGGVEQNPHASSPITTMSEKWSPNILSCLQILGFPTSNDNKLDQ